jgi:hypothetical protein
MRMRHTVICGLRRSTIFFYIISNDTVLKKLLNTKYVLIFSSTFAETFLIERSIELDIIKSVYYIGVYVKNPLSLSDFNEIVIFSTYFQKILKFKFYKNTSSGNRVVPCGRTDGQTDKHHEANSGFSQFCERA